MGLVGKIWLTNLSLISMMGLMEYTDHLLENANSALISSSSHDVFFGKHQAYIQGAGTEPSPEAVPALKSEDFSFVKAPIANYNSVHLGDDPKNFRATSYKFSGKNLYSRKLLPCNRV